MWVGHFCPTKLIRTPELFAGSASALHFVSGHVFQPMPISREAATECSPQRKLWESCTPTPVIPTGARSPARR
jgi:hypothetical protein